METWLQGVDKQKIEKLKITEIEEIGWKIYEGKIFYTKLGKKFYLYFYWKIIMQTKCN